MDWISQNREWLFSGVLISIPLAVIGWLFFSGRNKQVQKSGNNSINIQVGEKLEIDGKLNIGAKKENGNGAKFSKYRVHYKVKTVVVN
jgi:predicted negative regulator of RcsB-dependent stress response